MIQPTAKFITVIDVIAEMGLEPAYELASQVDKLMQESYEARYGHPPLKENFITVQQVIRDMGRDPSEELVSWVEERMAEWYEVHCGHAPIKAALDQPWFIKRRRCDLGRT
jgi:uncharacterized protein YneF (UPF0154 family)